MKIKLAILVLYVAHIVPVFAGSDDCLVPGDNLVIEGVPKIPTQLTDEVGRYTEFRFAGMASWHPLRRELLLPDGQRRGTRFRQEKEPGFLALRHRAFHQTASAKLNADGRLEAHHWRDPASGERRFLLINDGGGGRMSRRLGWHGPSGTTSPGLN